MTRAAVLKQADGSVDIEDLIVDAPQRREVLIDVKASGLCHSDLSAIDGHFTTMTPAVMGHEASGIVRAVASDVRAVEVGDHVVCCLSQFCSHCDRCLQGQTWLCENPRDQLRAAGETPRLRNQEGAVGQFGGLGALAEQMLVHENAVVVVPKELAFDRAALLGCAVLTGVGSVFAGARVEPGSSVAVIGCGGVGLNIVQGARLAGASEIIAIDLMDEKLELARTFGATVVINGGGPDVVAEIRNRFGGVDYAFDAVGRPITASQAFSVVRPGRTAYLVGVPGDGEVIGVPGPELVRQAKGLQGLLMGSNRFKRDVPRLAELYLRGMLNLDDLISDRISLDDVNAGFDAMRGGVAARSVVVF